MKKLMAILLLISLIALVGCAEKDSESSTAIIDEPQSTGELSTKPTDKPGSVEEAKRESAAPSVQPAEAIPEVKIEEPSSVYLAFQDATSLSEKNTTKSTYSSNRSFGELVLQNEYEYDSLYLSMAKALEGFYVLEDFYGNYGNTFIPFFFGIEKPKNRDEMTSLIEDASKYVTRNGVPLECIMEKLATLESVEGTIDTNARSYHFVIADLSSCAKEMNITETALGYILAIVEDYAPETTFKGNTYSCDLDVITY